MHRFMLTALLAAILMGCEQTSVLTPDKSESFARIETGISAPTSRGRVVELMGTPVEQSYRDLLGISYERLTFQDAKRAYTITLVNSVAVSKSINNQLSEGETR